MSDDPRNSGFNHGAPKPVPAGFGVFDDATRLHERLDDVWQAAHDRAWRLNMALRDVRRAVTASERAVAGERLKTLYTELVRFSPVPEKVFPDDYTPAEREVTRTGWATLGYVSPDDAAREHVERKDVE